MRVCATCMLFGNPLMLMMRSAEPGFGDSMIISQPLCLTVCSSREPPGPRIASAYYTHMALRIS